MEKNRDWICGLILFFVTVVWYWPATTFPFITFDDPWYVYNNPNVIKGLSWSGIIWAITSVEPSNWHPVTLWSHMADCSLYGLFAGGHHLTSILLHATTAVLLWWTLKYFTGWFWPSALVAALFAWHPLNVESVAWIAERKNVLSTCFMILTLWAYGRYVEHRCSLKYYLLALLLFALGLAAKSMLVTLPCLLLLLDFWPLRRISLESGLAGIICQTQRRVLLWEKLPFLALSIADGVITWVIQNQSGGVSSLATMPLEYRLVNIPVAYVTYVVKTICPFNLCAFYPFPETPDYSAALTSSGFLMAVIWLAWHWKNKYPWLLVGWFWFLGTLAPVIGLVQVGGQAWADRYAYVPIIGLFIIIAGALHECWLVCPQLKTFLKIGTGGFLFFCMVLTGRQLIFWCDSVTLFEQVAAVSPQNATSQELLAGAFVNRGQRDQAIVHYATAVRLRPSSATLQYELARELIHARRFAEAQQNLADALMQIPDDARLHNTRGVALMLNQQTVEAQKEFQRAIELKPAEASAYFNLGNLLLTDGHWPAAITNFNLALQFQPDWPEAMQKLAHALAANGYPTNAMVVANRALKVAVEANSKKLADQLAAELKTYQTTSTPQSSWESKQPATAQQP